jgi:hypothetical protein
MKRFYVAAGVLLLSASCFGQTLVSMGSGSPGSKHNQAIVAGRPVPKRHTAPAGVHPDVVVLPGDTVFAQLVDGADWKTAFYFTNLETHTTAFEILFLNDNGTDMNLPIIGIGTSTGVNVTLNPGGTLEFETYGTASTLTQGWAYILQTGSYAGDSIGASAVFRQSVPLSQPQEAVVPVVNQYEDHFVLVYDNTAYTTAMAVANPTGSAVIIPVAILDNFGNTIQTQTVSLGAYQHVAFTIASQWPITSGRLGSIVFLTSGYGIGALGLRFNGQAFTSFSVLENYNWVVQ